MKNILLPEVGCDVAELLDRGFLDKESAQSAKGIPDKRYYRPLTDIQPNSLLDYNVQQHDAFRAGPHKDIRFGDEKGLYSWATRKPLPAPGSRTALFEQPTHSHKYLGWEGDIPRGTYGGGKVKSEEQGKVLVTSATPTSIHFTVAHKKFPERFVMIKPQGWKKDKSWLLINKTPITGMPYQKVRYKKIPAAQVDKYIANMIQGDTLEAKVDGASSLIKLLKDGVEVVSYRTSKENNRPILYTEKMFQGMPKLNIPPELVGTILKGEVYGLRRPMAPSSDGSKVPPVPQVDAPDPALSRIDLQTKHTGNEVPSAQALPPADSVIPPQELGGILNSTIANAIQTQRAKNIRLRNMVYDIQQLGKKPVDWHKTPRLDRRKMIEQVLQHLPQDTFHISPAATTGDEARKLWEEIKGQQHALTTEGVVMWPHQGPPMKGKLVDDYDVHISGVFPGEGKYQGTGAGGFTYALEPGGPEVGRVGTGLTDELRSHAFTNPQDYIGRVARIQSQQQLPSGAYRAPSFIALHEDYNAPPKQASVLAESPALTFDEMYDLGIIKQAGKYRMQKLAEQIEKIADEGDIDWRYVGGAAGAAPPAASLLQYLSHDLPKYYNVVNEAPDLTTNTSLQYEKLLASLQPGDMGVAGYYNETDPLVKFLGIGSQAASGGPGEHGMVVGPHNSPKKTPKSLTAFHGGLHQGYDVLNDEQMLVNNIQPAISDANKLFKQQWKKNKIQALANYIPAAVGNYAQNVGQSIGERKTILKNRDYRPRVHKAYNLADEFQEYATNLKDQTTKSRPYIFMRPKVPLNGLQQEALKRLSVHNAALPYDFMGGVGAGIKSIFTPRINAGDPVPNYTGFLNRKGNLKTKNFLGACAADSAHCGSYPAGLLQSIGIGNNRTPRSSLPNEILLNPNLKPVGIINKGKMLQHLGRSAIGRTGLGLGAMGLTGGLGWGVGAMANSARDAAGSRINRVRQTLGV